MTDVTRIVGEGLCCGCGACAYMVPEAISMVDVEGEGRRPAVLSGMTAGDQAVRVCPGIGLEHDATLRDETAIDSLWPAWGPILEVWEGYASDPEIRFSGSSGGAITALALYCLEEGKMDRVLHTAARDDMPYLNQSVISRSRAELLRATGSRYSPASPCDSLSQLEEAEGLGVFIGKPCDVAATQKACKVRPDLRKKIGITIGFFCAGTPSTEGTKAMLRRMGVGDLDSLTSLRYRGNGWPGQATAVEKVGAGEVSHSLSYEESWGEVLSKHQQWRCKLCADHTAEFSDIAVGDPWYKDIEDGDPGQSLILARTARGRKLVLAAAAAGYLTIRQVDSQVLPASQPNLLRTRGALWGRLLACRLMGVAAPRYGSMPMFQHWVRELTTSQKISSILGTARRILRSKRTRRRL